MLRVTFSGGDMEIDVELGTYDIGDWPRHTLLGPFAGEREALTATRATIDAATQAVDLDKELP